MDFIHVRCMHSTDKDVALATQEWYCPGCLIFQDISRTRLRLPAENNPSAELVAASNMSWTGFDMILDIPNSV